MWRGFIGILMVVLLLAGCHSRDIDLTGKNLAFVLLPQQTSLAVIDINSKRAIKQFELNQLAISYAMTADGKVILPLKEMDNHNSPRIETIDRRTGQLSIATSKLEAIDLITLAADGTAFIRSAEANKQGALQIMALNTKTMDTTGIVSFQGMIHEMAALPHRGVLVSVSDPGGTGGGNLYVLENPNEQPKKLFPFSLSPFAPNQFLLGNAGHIAYFLYSGIPMVAKERREQLLSTVSDERLLNAHIDIWDLDSFQLQKRIYLGLPSAQNMVLGREQTLYVGHSDVGVSALHQISVVNTQTGEVREIDTVDDPASLQILGEHLLVASYRKSVMEVFHLPDLKSQGTINLDGPAILPPLSLP